MKSVYIILVICTFTKGQIPNLGFCPGYTPMANFEMDRFLGKWFEVERYFQFSEVATRCVVTDYAKTPSGKVFVSNEVTNRLTGIKRVIDGNLELTGKDGEGKLRVKYSTTPISTEATLSVLGTDYDSYAVIWSCSGFGLFNAQRAWVMTRERNPPTEILQQAYGILDKFKISRTFFVKTDQADCAVAASEINAANAAAEVQPPAEEQQGRSAMSDENPVNNAEEEQKPAAVPEVVLGNANSENQEKNQEDEQPSKQN